MELNPVDQTLLNILGSLVSQVDWASVFGVSSKAIAPTTRELKTPADLRLWLCEMCAAGTITPTELAQAMEQLAAIERSGGQVPTASNVRALRKIG